MLTVSQRVAEKARAMIPHCRRSRLRRRIAKELAMSVRTLTRRLAAEKTTFRRVLEQVRFDLAVESLAEGLPVTIVAFDAGYSNLSGFCHAFRRWTGASPKTAMRKAA